MESWRCPALAVRETGVYSYLSTRHFLEGAAQWHSLRSFYGVQLQNRVKFATANGTWTRRDVPVL